MEVLEVRALLSGEDLLGQVVDAEANQNVTQATEQSNAIVDQYSATVQQEIIDPTQQQLLEAMQQFVSETASSGASLGELGSFDGTPIEEFASGLGVDSTAEEVTADGATMAASELETAVGAGDAGTSSSESLFDQEADLAEISQQLVTDALAGSGSGSESSSSSSSDSASSGDSATTNDTTTNDATGGNANNTTTTTGEAHPLPDGVQFDDVTLPAAPFFGDLLQYRPTELTSFTHTTVIVSSSEAATTTEAEDDGANVAEGEAPPVATTVTTRSVVTTLTITISQTYIDADNWSISQSWTKEYTVSSSSSSKTPPIETEPESDPTDPSGSLGAASGASGAAADSAEVAPKPAPTTPTVPPEKHTSTSSSVETGVESFSVTVTMTPVGVASSVSYSKTDTITNSVGETWNDGSDTTGDFDQSGFSGSSSQSQTLNFSLSESFVTMADGTLGRKTTLGFSGSKTASMHMSGHYGNFEAEGTVLDKDGAPTTGPSRPMGSANNSPWMLPALVPADPTDPTITPTPDPGVGGNGSRFEAGGGFSISGSFATGFHLNGEVTMPEGTEIAESSITGTTGFYTTMESSAGVHDSLSFDDQSSSGSVLTGDDQFDYLSLGATNSAGGGMNFHFSLDMDLADADLPDAPPADEATDGSGSEESEDGSESGIGSEGASLTSGGTTGSDPDAEPEPGKPVVKFEFNMNSNDSNGVWLRYQSKTIEQSDGPVGENPLASPMKTSTQSGISIGLHGGVSTSTTADIFGLTPSITVQTSGHVNVTFVVTAGKVMEMHNTEEPPPGWLQLISDSERFYNYSDETISSVGFELTVVAAVSGLTLSGDATISFDRKIIDKSGCKSHLKYQNIDTGAIWETSGTSFTLYEGVVQTTGGIGTAGNALNTSGSETWGGGTNCVTTGETPTTAPPPTTQPFSVTTALDNLRTGLAIGGMARTIVDALATINDSLASGDNMATAMPAAIVSTFASGSAWDSFQGAFTQMADVMLFGATDFSGRFEPLYGDVVAHEQGTYVGTTWGAANWMAITFAPWSAAPSGSGVVVTHWGPSGMSGLRAGDWVMRGPANTMRYLLSGVAQPGRHFAWPSNFIMARVSQSALAAPPSWEALKWYLGQAIFIP